MWRFKHFMPKEQTGLDGRTIDIGNIKVHVRNAIAEGGFSSVYLARDVVHTSKQYALKHIMCNDEESLDLVKKEVAVMKSLKGHPNVVTLHAQAIFDMGRTKEALLVMEFCEKSLVSVLENRGTAYFEEKQILSIFRDICNAVFAMHCQSPPIAHRDLKAENVLLGPDGSWKLCDFGSTSTNHKRFDRPEEMGVEEDNIRKHTTPAYRAPEMWDLFRREIISEKVDIWALGCLLYRICYLKSAFDGESKLQILNGNYRIAELPKYSSSITDLIRDMLQGSPDDRPDITQVWFRVNEQLPPELQKQLPDSPALDIPDEVFSGNPGPPKKAPSMPRRMPPAPPSSAEPQAQGTSKAAGGGAPLGIFWSTQHAKESHVSEEKGPIFDEPKIESTSKHNHRVGNNSPPKGHRNTQAVRAQIKRSTRENSPRRSVDKPTKDIEINFFPEEKQNCDPEKIKMSKTENVSTFQNEAFNNFVADFDCSKLNPAKSNNNNNKFGSKKEELEVEVERLKEQLKQANLEKAEITSKYDKLSAICRSQRQEIQELKNALTEKSSSADKDGLKIQDSSGSWHSNTPQREKSERWEAQQGMAANSSIATSPESKPWLAFPDEPKSQHLSKNNQSKSVRTTERQKNKQSVVSSANDTWGFDQDSFVANPTSSQISRTTTTQGNYSQRFSEPKKMEQKQVSQPAGWAGF